MTSCLSHTAAMACLLASTAAYASNCESIRAQIEQKFRASGVPDPVVRVVDAAASEPGRNVGTCDLGTKKIIYTPGRTIQSGNAKTPKPSVDDALLTECRDGTTQIGGSCKKK